MEQREILQDSRAIAVVFVEVKCDRNKPCSRCHQRNLNCTYLRPLKKRGPKVYKSKSLRKDSRSTDGEYE
ncbi:AKR_collapsed_G0004980.mRNA.1.CDS.1 [Saccharomyces cerevisiae]|nr:AKR_collapsed_G0004980.mRNA.1.CDS.1 [Saccharomyces cerevisiae]